MTAQYRTAPPCRPNPSITRIPAATDGGGDAAGKTPSAISSGASTTVDAIEKTMLKNAWNPAYLRRRSSGHRFPSQRSAGVNAAQMYIAVIQPTNAYFQGTASPR